LRHFDFDFKKNPQDRKRLPMGHNPLFRLTLLENQERMIHSNWSEKREPPKAYEVADELRFEEVKLPFYPVFLPEIALGLRKIGLFVLGGLPEQHT